MPPLVLGSILKSAPGWRRGCFALGELVAVFAVASSSVKHWPARGAPLHVKGLGWRKAWTFTWEFSHPAHPLRSVSLILSGSDRLPPGLIISHNHVSPRQVSLGFIIVLVSPRGRILQA